jgi:hypothetical protein
MSQPIKGNPGQVLADAIAKSGVKNVRCAVCGKAHDVKADGFLTIYGDIHIGVWGAITGSNYTPETIGTDDLFILKKSHRCMQR